MSLPYIDEHSVPVTAPPAAVWAGLARVLDRQFGRGAAFARVLGAEPAVASPEFAAQPGDTVPGFRVESADPGHRLELRGKHRFSTYALTFTLDGDQLRAETRAAFPGVLGTLYRTAVIGTGAHRVLTRRLLRQVARAATRTR